MLSFFLLDGLGEIWDVTESVSEGFLTYSFYFEKKKMTELKSAQNIYFSGSSVSNEIYTKRE